MKSLEVDSRQLNSALVYCKSGCKVRCNSNSNLRVCYACGCIHWTCIFYRGSLEQVQVPGMGAHFSSDSVLSSSFY
jgi:hypothetical protein